MSITYRNNISKVLLSNVFDNQFAIPDSPPFILENILKCIDNLIEITHKNSIQKIKIEKPIFIISLPRSGSTVLQDILCSHSHVSYINNTMHQFNNCFLAADWLRKILRLNIQGERYLRDSIEVDLASPSEGLVFWGRWLKDDPLSLEYRNTHLGNLTSKQIDDIYYEIKKIIWCHKYKRRFFSKNPGLLPKISLIWELFPHAKIIHLIRDPRQTANSLIKLYRLNMKQIDKIRKTKKNTIFQNEYFVPYPRLPGLKSLVDTYGVDSIQTTAHLWNESIDFFYEKKEKNKSFMDVRFEDVVTDPKYMLQSIFDFCELPWETENTQLMDNIANIGNVRHKNTYSYYDEIESICHKNMKYYNYI